MMRNAKITLILILLLFLSTYSIKAVQVQYDGSSEDGYLSNNNADYSTARDAANADTVNDDGTQIKIGQATGWTIYRGYFYFNTAAIPDGVRIQNALLYFYVDSNPIAVRAISTSGLSLPRATLDLNGKDSFDIYSYELDGVPSGVSSTGWASIIITDDLISDGVPISKTGITKFGLVSVKDYNDEEYNTGIMNIGSTESAHVPYLIVQYNTPPSTPILTGGSLGSIQRRYTMEMVSEDDDTEAENNQIKYKINWGDGHTSWAKNDYEDSGVVVSASHQYEVVGDCQIKVVAYDNSGETNDESGTASRSITIQSKALSGEGGESAWDNFVSLFSWLLPPEDEGPNQKFKSLQATYVDGEEGARHLAIWWDVNGAADEQSDLMIFLKVETLDGITDLGTFNVKDHNSQEKALYVLNWDEKFPGYATWSFTLNALFLNPNEPAGSSTDDNTATLTFILGFPIYGDFFIALAILIILIIVIILLYRYRKQIFWARYIKKRPDAAEIREMPKGFEKDWWTKRNKPKTYPRLKAAKEGLSVMLGDWNIAKRKPKGESRGQTTQPIYTTQPVSRKKSAQSIKKRKTKERSVKETKKTKTSSERTKPLRGEFLRAKTIDETFSNPEIVRGGFPTNSEVRKKLKTAKDKKALRTEKRYNNLLKDVLTFDHAKENRDRVRSILNRRDTIGNKLSHALSKTTLGRDYPELQEVYEKVGKGKMSEKEAEHQLLRVFNQAEQEMKVLLKKRKYPIKRELPGVRRLPPTQDEEYGAQLEAIKKRDREIIADINNEKIRAREQIARERKEHVAKAKKTIRIQKNIAGKSPEGLMVWHSKIWGLSSDVKETPIKKEIDRELLKQLRHIKKTDSDTFEIIRREESVAKRFYQQVVKDVKKRKKYGHDTDYSESREYTSKTDSYRSRIKRKKIKRKKYLRKKVKRNKRRKRKHEKNVRAKRSTRKARTHRKRRR